MNEYTYRFFKNERHVHTQTFHCKNKEEAEQAAQGLLDKSRGKLDDFMRVNSPRPGTQRSPFGIGS